MDNQSDEIKPWKTLSSSVALNEKWFTVRKDTIELPSGKVIDDYFVWLSPSIAVAIPYTSDGKFVICQQYRHAAGKIMYQFPAGAVDKNETNEEAARRELVEETGYTSDDFEHLVDTAAYATKLTGWQHVYLARNAKLTQEPHNDVNEPTKVLLVSPKELMDLIVTNQFQLPESLAGALLAFRALKLDV